MHVYIQKGLQLIWFEYLQQQPLLQTPYFAKQGLSLFYWTLFFMFNSGKSPYFPPTFLETTYQSILKQGALIAGDALIQLRQHSSGPGFDFSSVSEFQAEVKNPLVGQRRQGSGGLVLKLKLNRFHLMKNGGASIPPSIEFRDACVYMICIQNVMKKSTDIL